MPNHVQGMEEGEEGLVAQTGREFFVVSVAHTNREHRYITFWRTDDKGYAWPLSWAGRYPEQKIRDELVFYNDGWHTIAVPVDVARTLSVEPVEGTIDGNAGPVVMNTRANWETLLKAAICEPLHTVKIPLPRRKSRTDR